MNKQLVKKDRRALRTRAKLIGTDKKPRLSVFRSNQFVYVQVINDAAQKTLFGVSEKSLGKEATGTKIERARKLGLLVAKLAKEKKITEAVFDRGSYAYHGRVKSIAEGAREGGLKF